MFIKYIMQLSSTIQKIEYDFAPLLRPRKKICVVQVTGPTLNFYPLP